MKNHFVNSQWNDEKIILNNKVYIGVAGIKDGLVVPIKNADRESLHSINSKVSDAPLEQNQKIKA